MTINYSFNPFNKSVSDLTTEDLVILKQVTEGWYVEYKQEVSSAKVIAKSISAFANTYGGWIFYGIAEQSKENSVAGEFPGIANDQLDQELQKIRQAVAGSINPACHYDHIVITGPAPELGLEADHSVIAIHIPESKKAPHIHASGCIYRRVSDGCEPAPEKDRHIIESLFKKSQETILEYKEWQDSDPEFSEPEESVTYVRLMIQPNLWDTPASNFHLSTEKAREIFAQSQGKISHIPYDTIHSTSSGVIARQCDDRGSSTLGMTWTIYGDLSSEILIPLSKYIGTPKDLKYHLRHYSHSREFAEALINSNNHECRIVDLNSLFNIIMSVVEIQRSFQSAAGWTNDFHIKTKILNAWRTIPYLDIGFVVNAFSSYGIPVCLRKIMTSPTGYGPDTFKKVKSTPDVDYQADVTLQTTFAFLPIAVAYGIPFQEFITHENRAEEAPFFVQLREAGERSKAIHKQ